MIIYIITNTINGKRYVGQTSTSLYRRWSRHKTSFACPALRGAIEKYGSANFSIEIICEVPTKELADEFEKESIERYCSKVPNGYNLSSGGEGSLGHKVSEESRKIISQKLKGNKCALGSVRSVETRKLLSHAAKNMSLEQRQLLREARLRQVCPRTGKKHSEASKLKMSEAHKRLWMSKA